ncbi:hypothetical protein CNMCM8812_006002 [Aspergillus fumigatus]|nr:hypothetical protein CNMCM8057_005941 [Aspergillus fumigatus]KAF4253591.1 hypothetical protein CNMCM8714_006115 [Aspergillus fumigatus]KAF4259021.1 hypothetical protein CNMCM8812_006002 [Aspergillus fumigatus]KAF4276998.1 hypothetical protein CNMCM8689_005214 [Aspergillus fumigatus]
MPCFSRSCRPERPRPPGELAEERGEDGPDDGAVGGRCAEDGKDHVLLRAGPVRRSQNRQPVREEHRGSEALRGAREDEQHGVAVDADAGDHGPDAEPDKADHEHGVVAEAVAAAAEEEDEGAHCQGVARDEPAEDAVVGDVEGVPDDGQRGQLATQPGLGHELGHAYHEDEDRFPYRGEAFGDGPARPCLLEIKAALYLGVTHFWLWVQAMLH